MNQKTISITLFLIIMSGMRLLAQDTLYYNQWFERVPQEMSAYYTVIEVINKKANITVYNNDGDRVHMRGFLNGKKAIPWDGRFVWFYYNGRTKHEGLFKGGKPNGIHNYYWNNGQMKAEETYEEGVLSGQIKEYYKDGRIRAESNVVNGILDGPTVVYHNNGRTKAKGFYKGGKKEGKWSFFDASGKLLNSTTYQTVFPIHKGELEIEFPSNDWKLVHKEGNDSTKRQILTFASKPITHKKVGTTTPTITIIKEDVDWMQDLVYYSTNMRLKLPYRRESDLSWKKGDFNTRMTMGYMGRRYQDGPYTTKGVVITRVNKGKAVTVIEEVNEILFKKYQEHFMDVIRSVRVPEKEKSSNIAPTNPTKKKKKKKRGLFKRKKDE
ncbi:hypothetical protein K5X82_04705 [Halosquirtibacter xylanolyticus]|uniref:toxin-antitoxin system YwqK family antitoxin n=1 Tax=Halosquirtibacter xylanolyticus TaxID=3374599 RepID=UPI003748815B|nr:hypothetical protein K5X82_04705 [Prolixibacteraceae bacterium]